ncbi:MAG: fumarylacetoacetate hydrolase family protein [Neomegalonema sp.]|nr:fumarylacetoacetate hydrolase family protein [Neomegalonema sp.]
MPVEISLSDALPEDPTALLVGRVWSNAEAAPVPALFRSGEVYDLSALAPTLSDLLELPDLADRLRALAPLESLGASADFAAEGGAAGRPLAPCDLQPIKAAGVTFAASMLERVIEEQAKGDPQAAEGVRARLAPLVGPSLRGLVAGSDQAMQVKQLLVAEGLWSQYLEVGIGPDAEVFTKAPPMAAVGLGADIGVHPISSWSNPEPEIVLVGRSDGAIIGATLGNDVNLRDVEGRSALLLGKAKDNNASCAIGPAIRLFHGAFTLATVEGTTVSLRVVGESDGFVMEGASQMAEISRKPADLMAQTIGAHHQYPDGLLLFLGTMFAPTQDRHGEGQGFTHEVGDVVTISAPELGQLVNRVDRTDAISPWTYGVRSLIRDLARRGLL